MATPAYQGQWQSTAATGGWLSRLGSMFGGGATPAYAGNGQPSSTSSGTPAYASAPVATSPEFAPDASCLTCPIDPEALAEGKIAIVIPTQG